MMRDELTQNKMAKEQHKRTEIHVGNAKKKKKPNNTCSTEIKTGTLLKRIKNSSRKLSRNFSNLTMIAGRQQRIKTKIILRSNFFCWIENRITTDVLFPPTFCFFAILEKNKTKKRRQKRKVKRSNKIMSSFCRYVHNFLLSLFIPVPCQI